MIKNKFFVLFFKLYKCTKFLLLIAFIFLIILTSIDILISNYGKEKILDEDLIPQVDAIIIFGAYVHKNGNLSMMLEDRILTGIKLYKNEKAPKILVSGDHGTKSYDEVNNMKKYLENNNIPSDDIFMDHAGFNTYDSLYRAKEIFEIENAVLVTQEYHLVRAIYIGEKLGLNVYGVPSDLQTYPGMSYYRLRDVFSRFKAFSYVNLLKPEPKYLGEKIPISGSGKLSHD